MQRHRSWPQTPQRRVAALAYCRQCCTCIGRMKPDPDSRPHASDDKWIKHHFINIYISSFRIKPKNPITNLHLGLVHQVSRIERASLLWNVWVILAALDQMNLGTTLRQLMGFVVGTLEQFTVTREIHVASVFGGGGRRWGGGSCGRSALRSETRYFNVCERDASEPWIVPSGNSTDRQLESNNKKCKKKSVRKNGIWCGRGEPAKFENKNY